jgi:hypothetical protein
MEMVVRCDYTSAESRQLRIYIKIVTHTHIYIYNICKDNCNAYGTVGLLDHIYTAKSPYKVFALVLIHT